MKLIRTLSTAIGFCLSALLVAAPATAFDVEEKLEIESQKLQKYAAEKGFILTKVMSRDRSLGEGGADNIKLDELSSIANYIAIGVCDSDCSGLGLTINKKVGIDDPTTLTEDIDGGETPIIEFFVSPFSEHTMTVSMMSCSTLICGYGVDIYRTQKAQ